MVTSALRPPPLGTVSGVARSLPHGRPYDRHARVWTTACHNEDMSNTVARHGYDPRHPVFRVPPHETPIWRYMPLGKLRLLLETQQLHLCRASKLTDDRFEGSVTVGSEAEN